MALKDWLLSLRNKAAGLVAYGGTISRSSETDEYPIAIANELMGGAHSYDTLGSLAEVHPQNLTKGMVAVVNQHLSPNGDTVTRTVYVLETVPAGKVSEEGGYDEQTNNLLSNYWKVFTNIADYEGSLETEYAPDVNSLRPSFDIGSPWYNQGFKTGRRFSPTSVDISTDRLTISNHGFLDSGIIKFDSLDTLPAPLSSATTYYAKAIDLDTLEIYLESGLSTLINLTDVGVDTHFIFEPTAIWLPDYDASGEFTFNGEPSVWMRQRVGTNSNWGMPVKIFGSGYQEGDYADTRFQWTLDTDPVPPVPAQTINGKPNNEPAGWFDTPDVPAGVTYTEYLNGSGPAPADVPHFLYKTTATKDVYGNLKTAWTAPYKISTDPDLVQYGNNPGTNPTDDPGLWDDFYSPTLHTHMASRALITDPWIITRITNEEGQYTDYAFKAFNKSYVVTEADSPTLPTPYGGDPPNDWNDAPVAVTDDQILYVTASTKFNDGSLKSLWSVPQRFDGEDTIQAIIETVDGYVFKYQVDANGAKVATPATITLEAKTYKGGETINTSSGLTYQWYKGTSASGTPLGTGDNTIVSPADVVNQQLYTVQVTHEGLVYEDTITILDVTDGQNYAVSIQSLTGFTWKGIETKTFNAQFYKDGVADNTNVTWLWELENYAVPDISDGSASSYDVTEADIDDYAELKLTATFGSYVAEWTERLSDIVDGDGLDVEYHLTDDFDGGSPGIQAPPYDDAGWGAVAADAYWMHIKKTTDADFSNSDAIRIRGEKGDAAGATVIFAFKNGAALPLTPDNYGANLIPSGSSPNDNWTDAPTGATPLSGNFTAIASTNIITSTAHGLETAKFVTLDSTTSLPSPLLPNNYYYVQKINANSFYLRDLGDTSTNIDLTNAGTGTHSWEGTIEENTYQTRRLFKLKAAAASFELNSTNWIAVDAWSTPIKISGKDGTAIGSAGPPGSDGGQGWSPEFYLYTDREERKLRLLKWVGGTGAYPSPTHHNDFVTANGFSSDSRNGVDIRGESGDSGSPDSLLKTYYLGDGYRAVNSSSGGYYFKTILFNETAPKATSAYTRWEIILDFQKTQNVQVTVEAWLSSATSTTQNNVISGMDIIPVSEFGRYSSGAGYRFSAHGHMNTTSHNVTAIVIRVKGNVNNNTIAITSMIVKVHDEVGTFKNIT